MKIEIFLTKDKLTELFSNFIPLKYESSTFKETFNFTKPK